MTTVCWVLTAFLGPQTDQANADRVLPEGPALRPGLEGGPRRRGHLGGRGRAPHENIPLALVGWVLGGALTIWSALFTVGNFLYGRWVYAGVLLAVFVVSGLVLIKVINRLWSQGAGRGGK